MIIEKKLKYDRYDCVIGCGYYFSGCRVDANGKTINVNLSKSFQPMLDSLESLHHDEKTRKARWLYVYINDVSPHDTPLLSTYLKTTDSYVHVRLDENVGCGGKENIIQTIGAHFSDRVFRYDADVKLTSSINPLFVAFDEIEKLGCATINAGFIGNMFTYANPTAVYIDTAQIGNAVIWDTNVFKKIGYTNASLRYFNDLDLVYKSMYAGNRSVMVMSVLGKTKSSGCGGTMDFSKQVQDANNMINSNPLVTYYLNGKGKPIIHYRKNYRPNMFGEMPRIETPTQVANEVLSEILR